MASQSETARKLLDTDLWYNEMPTKTHIRNFHRDINQTFIVTVNSTDGMGERHTQLSRIAADLLAAWMNNNPELFCID